MQNSTLKTGEREQREPVTLESAVNTNPFCYIVLELDKKGLLKKQGQLTWAGVHHRESMVTDHDYTTFRTLKQAQAAIEREDEIVAFAENKKVQELIFMESQKDLSKRLILYRSCYGGYSVRFV